MIKSVFYKIGGLMERVLPEFLCGHREVLEGKYRSRYGEREWREKALRERQRMGGLYFIVLLISLPLIIFQSWGALSAAIKKEPPTMWIQRPDYGEAAREERFKIHLHHRDIKLKERVALKIPSRELTEEEAELYILQYIDQLPQKILGRNKDLNSISEDLELPVVDGDIQLEWHSGNPDLIDERGQLNLLKAGDGEEIMLTVFITFKNLREEAGIPVRIQLPEKEDSYRGALVKEIRGVIGELQQKGSVEGKMVLPQRLPSGARVSWVRDEGGKFPISIFLLPLLFFLIYKDRYYKINRQIRRERQDMEKEFPEFIGRLILLLSAGLVAEGAIRKMVWDYEEQKRINIHTISPLYEALGEAVKRARDTNASLTAELSLMARKSRVRQLMRFSALLTDSIEKGTPLSKKLEDERYLIWQGRKKDAERKGRMAETKLILPLSILLLTIVLITISPVLIDV
ncbi:MAG: hypothetical protein ACOX4U_00230 [Anaerovoracaceae bacterium]|jgi:tight adherence protein C